MTFISNKKHINFFKLSYFLQVQRTVLLHFQSVYFVASRKETFLLDKLGMEFTYFFTQLFITVSYKMCCDKSKTDRNAEVQNLRW